MHGQDLFCIYSKSTDDFFKSFWGITQAMSEIMWNPSESSGDEIFHIGQLFVYKTHFVLWIRHHWSHRNLMHAKTFLIDSPSFYIFNIFLSVSCLFTYKPKCKQKIDRKFSMGIFGPETTKNQLLMINLCPNIVFRHFYTFICLFFTLP